MLWHYHDDDVETGKAVAFEDLTLKGFTAKTLNLHHYRIDRL